MTPLALVLLAVGGATGAVLGRSLRLPMWPLTGSILGGVLVHLLLPGPSAELPTWWHIAAQVLVGTVVGSGIGRDVLREFASMLVPATVAVASIIGVGIAAGLVIASTGEAQEVVAVLGMIPGGVGEMVAAATALDADSALVAAMHVVRLVVVLSVLPVLIRLVGFAERRFREGGQ